MNCNALWMDQHDQWEVLQFSKWRRQSLAQSTIRIWHYDCARGLRNTLGLYSPKIIGIGSDRPGFIMGFPIPARQRPFSEKTPLFVLIKDIELDIINSYYHYWKHDHFSLVTALILEYWPLLYGNGFLHSNTGHLSMVTTSLHWNTGHFSMVTASLHSNTGHFSMVTASCIRILATSLW